jgi:hypothetical protein
MKQITENGRNAGIKVDILSAADPHVGILNNLTPLVSMLSDIGNNYRLVKKNIVQLQTLLKNVEDVIDDFHSSSRIGRIQKRKQNDTRHIGQKI